MAQLFSLGEQARLPLFGFDSFDCVLIICGVYLARCQRMSELMAGDGEASAAHVRIEDAPARFRVFCQKPFVELYRLLGRMDFLSVSGVEMVHREFTHDAWAVCPCQFAVSHRVCPVVFIPHDEALSGVEMFQKVVATPDDLQP